jgi:kynurenine formamidase
MGTHIDALNHFGLHGKIWNGFDPDKELGDRGWKKTGAETIPPIVARGVLIDIAAAKGVAMLEPLHRVTAADLKAALAKQGTTIQRGDVVLVRTGRMTLFDNAKEFTKDPPGLSPDGAAFLADAGAMIVGADNLSLETFPSQVEGDWVPVHTYLLAHKGIPIIEMAVLDALAKDRVYAFAFVGGSLKLRGASAAPIRPVAIAFR